MNLALVFAGGAGVRMGGDVPKQYLTLGDRPVLAHALGIFQSHPEVDGIYLVVHRDWEATGFWNPSASFNHARLFDNLYDGFAKWPGETINERIEAYVLDLGFTKKDIGHFRDIMLEK